MISEKNAPWGLFNRYRIFAALLPSRVAPAFFAPLGAFLAALAFFPALLFLAATWAERAPARAFLLPLGWAVAVAWAVPVSSLISVVIVISLGGVSAIT